MQSKHSICKDLTLWRLIWAKLTEKMETYVLYWLGIDTKLELRMGVWHKCLESDWLKVSNHCIYFSRGFGQNEKWIWLQQFHFGTQLHTWNKLKSFNVTKWKEDEWRMMNEEWWRMNEEWKMKDDDFKLLKGFAFRWMDRH